MNAIIGPAPKPIVLVVDDVPANRELLAAMLEDLGYDVREAADGVEALERFDAEEPDLVLLDIEMPRLDGLSLCRRLKDHPTRRLVPVVLVTAYGDRATHLAGVGAGADDFLTKPIDMEELRLRVRVLLRDRALNKRLDAADTVILALARVVEARDLYTVHHAERVGQYSREIGVALGRTADDLQVLYRGGVLHDLGKAVVPAEILLKPGAYTPEERTLMEQHSIEGERICLPLHSTAGYLPIIRHHHERVDGAGYPDRLVGNGIPLGARIAAVADAWDAMTSDRPYRPSLPQEEALRRLHAGAGRQWDAGLVEVFASLVEGGIVRRVAALGEGGLPDPLAGR